VGGGERMKKHYIKSDGNGGVNIGKGTLAIIGTFMMILQFVIATVSYQVTTKVQVDNIKSQLEEHNHIQQAYTLAMNAKVEACCQDNAVLTSKVDRIEQDIKEIKGDVKSIARG
jgi:peptidoglycan hydrolase CwlO-like protein